MKCWSLLLSLVTLCFESDSATIFSCIHFWGPVRWDYAYSLCRVCALTSSSPIFVSHVLLGVTFVADFLANRASYILKIFVLTYLALSIWMRMLLLTSEASIDGFYLPFDNFILVLFIFILGNFGLCLYLLYYSFIL